VLKTKSKQSESLSFQKSQKHFLIYWFIFWTIFLCVLGIFFTPFVKAFALQTHVAPPSIKSTSAPLSKKLVPTKVLSATSAPVQTYSGYCLRVPVLMYHHIQPWADAQVKKQISLTVDNGTFENQMAYLQSHGYQSATAKALVDALRNHSGLPAKTVVLTFDDGYRDNYTYAFPVLKKYGLTGNLLLASGLMEGPDYLTWSQVSDMKSNYYFVDHTWSHASLGNAAADKIHYEVETAKNQIQDHTGQTVDIFGYPYGSFGSGVISILQADGFLGAFSTIPGTMQCDSFIMALHRTRIGNSSLAGYGL